MAKTAMEALSTDRACAQGFISWHELKEKGVTEEMVLSLIYEVKGKERDRGAAIVRNYSKSKFHQWGIQEELAKLIEEKK